MGPEMTELETPTDKERIEELEESNVRLRAQLARTEDSLTEELRRHERIVSADLACQEMVLQDGIREENARLGRRRRA